MIRILIADDHAMFRDAVRDLLERADDLTVAGVASTAEEAVVAAGTLGPDIVLMDLIHPDS